ncbi:MAG: tetratricopeptide repeat protein [Desulfovibrio sp.]
MNSTTKLFVSLMLLLLALSACSTRTQASMASSDPAQSVALYKQALAENPDSARTRIKLGKALIHNGEYTEATARLSEALQILPDDPEAQFYLALTEIGRSGPGGALEKLMNYRPYNKTKLGEIIRLDAQRASVRNLTADEVIRRMENTYQRGAAEQQVEDRRTRMLIMDK